MALTLSLKYFAQDFFAIELLDGHLYVHVDLGSGAKKVRSSRYELNDAAWHRIELTLRKRAGRITVDGETDSFETPGKYSKYWRGSYLYYYCGYYNILM